MTETTAFCGSDFTVLGAGGILVVPSQRSESKVTVMFWGGVIEAFWEWHSGSAALVTGDRGGHNVE
jgi:hypothetical protein